MKTNRREFLKRTGRITVAGAAAGVAALLIARGQVDCSAGCAGCSQLDGCDLAQAQRFRTTRDRRDLPAPEQRHG